MVLNGTEKSEGAGGGKHGEEKSMGKRKAGQQLCIPLIDLSGSQSRAC